MINISIKSLATSMLRAVGNAVGSSKTLFDSIGQAAVAEMKQNFRELNFARSRYGHNFYNKQGTDRTEYVAGGNFALVRVRSYQMLHKLKGGTVRARNVKMLAIPLSELAKQRGESPSRWDNLFLVKSKRGNLLLMSGKNKSDWQAHFILRRSVTHKPHPEVIPERARLIAAAKRGIEDAKFLSNLRF